MEFVLGIFHALTLKFPIQTSLSVAPKLPISLSSHEKCSNFGKTGTPQVPTGTPNQLALLEVAGRGRKIETL